MSETIDFNRRFGGVARLYGDAGLVKLQASHIVVVGIGGVGSWAVEALVRNAVGTISLIDLDNIAESNVNRQIHALDGEFGKAKVTAMRERILRINPACNVHELEDFITQENVNDALGANVHAGCRLVIIDATDDVKAKIAMADFCKASNIALVMAGAAGGRLDPTRIQTADLSVVTGDKLLAKVRHQLRRDYDFPKASNAKKSAKFGITCVYSDEPTLMPNAADTEVCALEKSDNIVNDALQANTSKAATETKNPRAITGLNCAGYGSSVCVTAPMGFALAQLAINLMIA